MSSHYTTSEAEAVYDALASIPAARSSPMPISPNWSADRPLTHARFRRSWATVPTRGLRSTRCRGGGWCDRTAHCSTRPRSRAPARSGSAGRLTGLRCAVDRRGREPPRRYGSGEPNADSRRHSTVHPGGSRTGEPRQGAGRRALLEARHSAVHLSRLHRVNSLAARRTALCWTPLLQACTTADAAARRAGPLGSPSRSGAGSPTSR